MRSAKKLMQSLRTPSDMLGKRALWISLYTVVSMCFLCFTMTSSRFVYTDQVSIMNFVPDGSFTVDAQLVFYSGSLAWSGFHAVLFPERKGTKKMN